MSLYLDPAYLQFCLAISCVDWKHITLTFVHLSTLFAFKDTDSVDEPAWQI